VKGKTKGFTKKLQVPRSVKSIGGGERRNASKVRLYPEKYNQKNYPKEENKCGLKSRLREG